MLDDQLLRGRSERMDKEGGGEQLHTSIAKAHINRVRRLGGYVEGLADVIGKYDEALRELFRFDLCSVRLLNMVVLGILIGMLRLHLWIIAEVDE